MTKPTTDLPILDDDAVGKIEALSAKVPDGPWFVDKDDAEDVPDHRRSGLALVDTGRSGDWWIARLCEWHIARFIAESKTNVPALCQTVRALRAEKAEQRGLTLISALINFADWLHAEGLLTVNDERERAQLVLKFFDAHSEGENYFMQSEQIMEILGKPFQETQ